MIRKSIFGGLALLLLLAGQHAQAVNPQRGQQIYMQYCAGCHGPRGEGLAPEAPKFQMGERLNQPDIVLMQSVKMGKKGMPPFFGVLKDQDIFDVLGFVRTLR